jgi:outer membrane protein
VKRSQNLLLLACLAWIAACAAARAQTLAEALAAAHATHPEIEDAELGVKAALEDRVQARAAYLPSLNFDAGYGATTRTQKLPGGRPTSTDLEPYSSSFRLSESLYSGGERDAQSRLARAGIDQARHLLQQTEQSVLLAVVSAYAGVIRDRNILAFRQAYAHNLDEELTGAQKRLDAGQVSRTDVVQVEARLASAVASLAVAEADLANTQADYVAVVGVAPDALAPLPPPPPPPASLQEAIARASDLNPRLLQARDAVSAASARVGVERAALLPRLSLSARWNNYEDVDFAGDRQRDSNVMMQLSIPLFEGGLNRSRTRQAQINVERAYARRQAEERTLEQRVVTGWSALSASQREAKARRQAANAAAEAVSGVSRELGLGLRATIDVLDAQRDQQEAEIAAARAEAQSFIAAYNLRAAIGILDLSDASPQFP